VEIFKPAKMRKLKPALTSITKQGSKHVRRMLVQVAHAISRTRSSRLKSFFMRIKAKKGTKVAVVALARKVLCIFIASSSGKQGNV